MMGALLQTGCCSSASVHTVIPTECSPYMLWQSVGEESEAAQARSQCAAASRWHQPARRPPPPAAAAASCSMRGQNGQQGQRGPLSKPSMLALLARNGQYCRLIPPLPPLPPTPSSAGFYFSHRRSGQPGPFTRIVCCDSPDKVSAEELSLVPTHLAPSYTFNPHNSDAYLPYNKPVAIMDWLGRCAAAARGAAAAGAAACACRAAGTCGCWGGGRGCSCMCL